MDQELNASNLIIPTNNCVITVIDNSYDGSIDKWNSLKDKNDNLEESVSADGVEIEKVCRTCFNLIESDAYLKINRFEDTNYLNNLINMCLPKIDLQLTTNPIVCHKCFTKLDEFHNFSVACMKTESELVNYCSQVSIPINICDFLKHSLKNSDFIAVKQEEWNLSNENKVEDDNEVDTRADTISNNESNNVDVKSEDEAPSLALNESNSTVKRPKRTLRRARNTSMTKLQVRGSKRHFSTDLIEAPVKCETCGQKFMSKWALDRHIPVHNTENSNYFCESCNIKFKYKHSYNKHVNAHLTGAPLSKPFACECGKFFNRKSKLKKHQEIHVKKDKPFACGSCGKRFLDEKFLESHVERVHMNEKPFSCELCGNKYTSKAGLDVHVKSHFPNENPRPVPDLMCDICGKLFNRKYSLEKHHMSHTGDKPHECDQCKMKFKERYQLTIHMRRHTGEKPFKCEVCAFKFPSKNRLGVHMRIHTGVRPFPCQLCDMAFTRNDHLIKHVRAIHTGERPFECDICSKTFNRKDYLLKHKRVHFKRSA